MITRKTIVVLILLTISLLSEQHQRPSLRFMTLISSPVKGTLEINGERSFFSTLQKDGSRIKIELDQEHGRELFDKIYKIPNLKKYLHQSENALNTEEKYVFMVFDERPEHYSEKSTIYVFTERDVGALEVLSRFVCQFEKIERDPEAHRIEEDEGQ